MFPPSRGYSLDIEAISGILGSVSIACWVVVFSPQIIENFRRSSAEGLSVEFVIIWLAGDVFNILGAILQGVLPTMIILAIYYTFADIVLLAQCFYYRGFSLRDPRPDEVTPNENQEATIPTETTSLLDSNPHEHRNDNYQNGHTINDYTRRNSHSSFRERFTSLDGALLSPATPMHPQPRDSIPTQALTSSQPRSWTQAILFNGTAVILVVFAGVAGYYSSPSSLEPDNQPSGSHKAAFKAQQQSLQFSLWGQIFGYICAILYLGSRIPQLLLNYRRKSTEGLNVLFFLFACIGNLTYVMSILAFEPICRHGRQNHGHAGGKQYGNGSCRPGEAGAIYERYILVNLSWLLGSLGTLFLDFGVFTQFFMYRTGKSSCGED